MESLLPFLLDTLHLKKKEIAESECFSLSLKRFREFLENPSKDFYRYAALFPHDIWIHKKGYFNLNDGKFIMHGQITNCLREFPPYHWMQD